MNQERDTQILFASVFIGVPVLYILWRLMPYILFYVVPFVALSAIFAGIWLTAVKLIAEDDYSSLGLIIPVTAIAIFLLAGFPKVYLVVKPGNLPIDGIYFYDSFNAVKAWFDQVLWSLIPDGLGFLAPKVPGLKEPYDFNNVRWILWAALGIGAPVAFRFIANYEVSAIKALLEAKYQKIAQANSAKLDAARAEKRRAMHDMESRLRAAHKERDYYREEHTKLKTLLEFQKKTTPATNQASNHETKGILDSEDL